MIVIISGLPESANGNSMKGIMEEFTYWVCKKLMHGNMVNSITVEIHVKKMNMFKGSVEHTSGVGIKNPRQFKISLNMNLLKDKEELLRTLAHELVHVKQYAKNELGLYIINGQRKWQDENVPDSIGYWDSPWEIEAYGREVGLFEMFKVAYYKKYNNSLTTELKRIK